MKKIFEKTFFKMLLSIIAIFSTVIINAQWQKKSSGFPVPQRSILELIAVNNNVAWGIGDDAFIPVWEHAPTNDFTRTTDGGQHWTAGSISNFSDYNLVGIAPLSATLCYGSLANFTTGNSKVVKTTDGGITWTEQLNFDFGESFGFFADIYFFNANEGLVYGDQSDGYMTIFTTQDGGNHWTRVPQANLPAALPDEASYVFSTEGKGNTFWTVSTVGRIWKTTDKGLHWNAYATDETYIEFSNLKMRDELHGLWGVHGELYRTDDGGVTWEEVEYSGTWFTNDLAFVPGTASTWVSTGAHDFPGYEENGSLHGIGTSYSVDDGNTWITIDTAVEHPSIAMVNAYTGFTGGINTNGSNGMFKYTGSALGYSCGNNITTMCYKGNTICVANASIQNLLAKGAVLGACAAGTMANRNTIAETEQPNNALTVYPNPVSSSTTISFSIDQAKKVSLRIFDLNGRLITTLANEKMQAGAHEIKWNVNSVNGKSLLSGIYLLRIEAGDIKETRKIFVIK